MKLTLLTYDCTVAAEIGYNTFMNVDKFVEHLTKWRDKFANAAKIPPDTINWIHVQNSDWCNNCIVLFANVPRDWEPTPNTFVYGRTKTFWDWMVGQGRYTDSVKFPPESPHELFVNVC
jgi:hypothetical protein